MDQSTNHFIREHTNANGNQMKMKTRWPNFQSDVREKQVPPHG